MRALLGRWWPLVIVFGSTLAVSIFQPQRPLTALIVPGIVGVLVFVLVATALVVALVRKTPRSRVAIILAGLLLSGVFVGLCAIGGPLWMRFTLSRSELHDTAMLAVQGKPPATPLRVGMFDAKGIAVDGGIVRIRTYHDEISEQGVAFYPYPLPDTEIGDYTYFELGWHRGQWYVFEREGGT